MRERTLGIDLGVKSPNVAAVWEEQGHRLIKVLRFELSLPEIKRVEEVALRGMAEGTKLHVVMEKTYPSCKYVSEYFLNQGHKVSFNKPDQVKEGRKFLWGSVKTDEKDAFVMARLPYLDPRQLTRAHVDRGLVQELKCQVPTYGKTVEQR